MMAIWALHSPAGFSIFSSHLIFPCHSQHVSEKRWPHTMPPLPLCKGRDAITTLTVSILSLSFRSLARPSLPSALLSLTLAPSGLSLSYFLRPHPLTAPLDPTHPLPHLAGRFVSIGTFSLQFFFVFMLACWICASLLKRSVLVTWIFCVFCYTLSGAKPALTIINQLGPASSSFQQGSWVTLDKVLLGFILLNHSLSHFAF